MIDWTKFLPNARHVATLPRLKPRTAICRLNVVQIGFRQFLWLRKQMAFAPHEWKPAICDVAAFRNIQFFPASKLKDLLMLLSPNPQVAGPQVISRYVPLPAADFPFGILQSPGAVIMEYDLKPASSHRLLDHLITSATPSQVGQKRSLGKGH